MKRLAWLLLSAILSFSTVGFSPSDSPIRSVSSVIPNPPAISAPGPNAFSIPGYNVACKNIKGVRVCASVSDEKFAPGTRITVYGMLKKRGVGIAGKTMKVVWQSKGTVTCSGVTDENGVAKCTAYFKGGIKGKKVHVKVTIDKYKVATFFISR
jgi:hypothetical protein